MAKNRQQLSGVAIIGMEGRFPGAASVEALWENLCEGIESIKFFSEEEVLATGVDPDLLGHPDYVKAWGYLDDVDKFDANYFGIPAREAEAMDPQHRLFLEVCVAALENAGYNPDTYSGPIGLVCGVGLSTYLLRNLAPNADRLQALGEYLTFTGNDKDFMGTRVSYKLNLRGPSHSVSTACSTSLVAVHLACRQLLSYQADIALAGASNIKLPQESGYLYRKGHLKSPDGRCHAFDAKARGTVFGNGVATVVLKRAQEAYEDGDHIYGIIAASALNNDGASKAGYTAPSVNGQAEVIAHAHELAGFPPETITHMEAHGTGTEMGDPIEVRAVSKTLGQTDRKQFCALTSVKTNVGHLDCAGGVTGLIKVGLSLKYKKIPPSINFETPNPEIDFASSPFFVPTTLMDWQPPEGIPRRACVSAFGAGGTNAHAVLYEAPEREPASPGRPKQLLLLSAKTLPALESISDNLVAHLKRHPELELADVVYTMNVGRRVFSHRRMLVCDSIEDLIAALSQRDERRVITGQANFDDDRRSQEMSGIIEQLDNDGDLEEQLTQLGRFWLEGGHIKWNDYYKGERRHRLVLPTYPFESRRYWIDQPSGLAAASEESLEKAARARSRHKRKLEEWFYSPTWQMVVRTNPRTAPKSSEGCWLVFCDSGGTGSRMAKRIRVREGTAYEVYMGEQFQQPDDETFVIDPADPGHYNSILTRLTNRSQKVQGFIHFWNLSAERRDTEDILNLSLNSLVYLAQAIQIQEYGHRLRLIAVTNHVCQIKGHDVIYPEKAIAIGPVQVIPQELDHVDTHLVDIEVQGREGDVEEGVLDELYRQCLDPWEERILAVRDGRLWFQAFQQLNLPASEPDWLRERGTYLVTGGLGGLGLCFAEYLAERAKARLVLTGRSELPARETWQTYLATESGDEATVKKIRKILELEAMGAEVLVFGVDVTDAAAMKKMVVEAEASLGKIEGVIHAAGVAGVATLQRYDQETARRFLRSKLEGTLSLKNLFTDHDLRFFALCSSLASFMGGYGQVAYVSANAFLDAFSQSAEAIPATTAINWDAWQEVGMAAMRQTENLQQTGILPPEGQEAMSRSLSSGMRQVIVSTTELAPRVAASRHLEMDASLADTGDDDLAYPRPDLSTPYVAPRNELETFLTDTWKKILGISSVGIDDDFFELGGDSLKGMNLVNALEKRLGETFDIETLFDLATTAQLAAYLEKKYGKQIAGMLGHTGAEDQDGAFDEQDVYAFASRFPKLPPFDGETGHKNKPAVFILSPPRNGATLLRVMLGGHPQLFAPPELFLLGYNTLKDRKEHIASFDKTKREGLIQAMMSLKSASVPHITSIVNDWESEGLPCKAVYHHLEELIAQTYGSGMLVDRTSAYCFDLKTLERAEQDFHQPYFIHLTRHPYGAVYSFESAQTIDFLRRFTNSRDMASVRTVAEMAYLTGHVNIQRFLTAIPEGRQLRISFEDLVTQPRSVMEDISHFLGIDFHDGMLKPYKEKSKRMTDPIYTGSMPLGDAKFHQFDKIEAKVATQWQSVLREDFLNDMTWRLAEDFGYPRIGERAGTKKEDEIVRADREAEPALAANVDEMDSSQVDRLLAEMLKGK